VRPSLCAASYAAALLFVFTAAGSASAQDLHPPADPNWSVPQIGALPYDAASMLIRRGHDLVTATYAHIGPAVTDTSRRYAGNNLACSSCHLNAGTKKFGIPLWGLKELFPQYSFEAGKDITIEDRINSCMTRSMNGKPLPVDSPEMQAFVAYINFLSQGATRGEKLSGLGEGRMPELKRAADPARGKTIYAKSCAPCHQLDGRGVLRNRNLPNFGYVNPPLWGPDSFNDGAGMATLITIANFVHFNMPNGTSYTVPRVSQQDAWDVGAYVISQPRPRRAGLDKDFPDRLDKPADIPYGPYADGFSQKQHMYGPFAPIRAAIEKLKAQQKKN
jgi:thiosulfate dehydrogenase